MMKKMKVLRGDFFKWSLASPQNLFDQEVNFLWKSRGTT